MILEVSRLNGLRNKKRPPGIQVLITNLNAIQSASRDGKKVGRKLKMRQFTLRAKSGAEIDADRLRNGLVRLIKAHGLSV